MKTYEFHAKSTPGGMTAWVCAIEDGKEVKRADLDPKMETYGQFHRRMTAELEAQGYQLAEGQYSL
ncbi:MAG: hypothetical protein IKM51_00030 [Oscillospiraceae bacterium]|nr:hypothetical protein [Oscillospiraceae bacterium]